MNRQRATEQRGWHSPLSVVILTKNEAQNLPRCVGGIPLRFPVIVLDSGSTDGTRELALTLDCLVVEQAWLGFAGQRNFALDHCGIKSPWVLFVDADEVYGEAFFEWFEKAVASSEDADAYMVPSYLFLNGAKLKYAPGYPVVHPRLVRRDSVRFTTNHTDHGESIPKESRVRNAPVAYDNYFFRGDIVEWMQKHIKTATLEVGMRTNPQAVLTWRGRLSLIAGRGMIRVPLRFLYHYLFRAGFLDGAAGFQYSLMYAWYEMTKALLLRAEKAKAS